MSRARPIHGFGRTLWFDIHNNGKRPRPEQLELLAAAENISVDDLLDEGLTQGSVITRLRKALGLGVIPPEVLERQRLRKIQSAAMPDCRICDHLGWECEGSITRHHFVPRWMILQLENYHTYSSRSRCTIPICISRHRDLHTRDGRNNKSIVEFMTDSEREFAQRMLEDLEEQHPKIFRLLIGGDSSVYEAQLVKDYLAGKFGCL